VKVTAWPTSAGLVRVGPEWPRNVTGGVVLDVGAAVNGTDDVVDGLRSWLAPRAWTSRGSRSRSA
jgi:hypothetical protein